MATTTNYGWETPDDTDLVKDGALAQRTTASAIDSSLYSITGGKNVGYVHLNTTSFTASSGVAIDNVFTSTYTNYKILINLTASSGSLGIGGALRASGVTNSTSNYTNVNTVTDAASGPFRSATVGGAYWGMGAIYTGGQNNWNGEMTIYNPQLATYTSLIGQSHNWRPASAYIEAINLSCLFTATTQFDGFWFAPVGAGNITGTIRIYGIRNS